MRSPLVLSMALGAASLGCAMSIPESVPYPGGPTASDPTPGGTLCARTATAARSLSSAQAAGGWTLGALGVASTGSGIFATLVNDIEWRRITAAGLTLGGVA